MVRMQYTYKKKNTKDLGSSYQQNAKEEKDCGQYLTTLWGRQIYLLGWENAINATIMEIRLQSNLL